MICGGKKGGEGGEKYMTYGLDTEVESGFEHPSSMPSRMKKIKDVELFGNQQIVVAADDAIKGAEKTQGKTEDHEEDKEWLSD